jgi:ubiquinone/menaquinone biosynthesis C-methylase UbiE
MALSLRLRDLFVPPLRTLEEAGLQSGFRVLDYGCGAGSYIAPAAALVGATGRIYALDVHPLAIDAAQKIAFRKQLANVETVLSDCETGLPDDEVDVVLLYDVLHHLSEPKQVLQELHRVLKPEGVLSVSDHHLTAEKILTLVSGDGLFKLIKRGRRTYRFTPTKP